MKSHPPPVERTPTHLLRPGVPRIIGAPVVVEALRKLGRAATVSEIALAAYGVSTPQTRNRTSVHLNEQQRAGNVLRCDNKHGSAWDLVNR